jgi:drug/metabolite transporter (DMT)-like permease
MSAVMWFGALLVVCGVVTLALAAVHRGQLSDSHVDPGRTLEPWRMRGGGRNWPGLVLIAVGAITLLIGALVYPQ